MRGDPKAKYASQQQDYVNITSNGKTLGRDGKVIVDGLDGFKPSYHPESHIPLSEWKTWRKWDDK